MTTKRHGHCRSWATLWYILSRINNKSKFNIQSIITNHHIMYYVQVEVHQPLHESQMVTWFSAKTLHIFISLISVYFPTKPQLQFYQNNFDFFELDSQALLPSVPCNILKSPSTNSYKDGLKRKINSFPVHCAMCMWWVHCASSYGVMCCV